MDLTAIIWIKWTFGISYSRGFNEVSENSVLDLEVPLVLTANGGGVIGDIEVVLLRAFDESGEDHVVVDWMS
jgi:hypothetical protein